MPRRLILSLLAASSILCGCAGGPPPTQAPKLIPPASLTTLEDPPPPPASGTMADLYENHLEAMRLYWRQREAFRGLIEWLETTDAALR